MKLYITVRNQGQAEQIIEKSRFIAYVSPAETKEEADEFIAAIKKKHKDATHNVPAMVIGDKFQIQWASDDGEPQGTSGAPIVQLLVSEGITNVVIVVTRYFGGIKLGTGGLVRAYTSSAKLGLEAAGICTVEEMCMLTYEIDYTYLSKLQNLASSGMFTIKDTEYTDTVMMTMCMPPEKREAVIESIVNLTAGKSILKKQHTEFVKI